MQFSASEIYLSVISATVYGAICGIFYIFIMLLFRYGRTIVNSIAKASIVAPDDATESPVPEILAFLFTVAFGIGFILLSYYSLDGEIRVYMLILSLCSLLVFSLLLKRIFVPIADRIFSFIFNLIFKIINVFIWPFLTLGKAIIRKISKKRLKKQQNQKVNAYMPLTKQN